MAGSYQFPVSSFQFPVSSFQKNRITELATGNWQLATELATGNW
jgi:hypothetical protein